MFFTTLAHLIIENDYYFSTNKGFVIFIFKEYKTMNIEWTYKGFLSWSVYGAIETVP